MDTKMIVCCLCKKFINQFASDKVEIDGRYYHAECIRTKVPNAITNAHVGQKRPVQGYFRFKEAQ